MEKEKKITWEYDTAIKSKNSVKGIDSSPNNACNRSSSITDY